MASHSELPARVLLTGANGFTGQYVSAELASAGFEVIDGSQSPDGLDLLKPDSIARVVNTEQFDYVVHLAAISFVANVDAAAFYKVNTVGTSNLLEALVRAEQPLKKVVIASSASVYGNAKDDPITELTLPNPVNHYACSKLAMECMARTYDLKLPLLITRPFNYTGPGQAEDFLVPKLVSHFARRLPSIKSGNIEVVRDFSDVRTIACIYARLLKSAAVGETINICSGVGRSLRWIIEALTELSGHRIEIVCDPQLIRPAEVHRSVGDPSRLHQAIGPVGFDDFRTTLGWMLASV